MSREDVESAEVDLTELSTRYKMQLLGSNTIFASLPKEKMLRPLADIMSIRIFQVRHSHRYSPLHREQTHLPGAAFSPLLAVTS